MTQAILSSVSVTDLAAQPITLTTGGVENNRMVAYRDYITPAQALATDIWYMLVIPSNALIHSLDLVNEDKLDTNGSPTVTINVGVYNSPNSRGFVDGTTIYKANAVISATCIQSAGIQLQSKNATGINLLDCTQVTLDKADNPVWKLAGLAADPGGDLMIGIAIGTNAATFSAKRVGLRAVLKVVGK